jgi:hypothetical protein
MEEWKIGRLEELNDLARSQNETCCGAVSRPRHPDDRRSPEIHGDLQVGPVVRSGDRSTTFA